MADIALPAAQTRLVEAVAATGTPLVVILVQGRPYTLPPVVESASAILVASYNGPFGPEAVSDVIFGVIDPSGKLPYSIPRHTGQIPVYHHQRAGTGYRNPLPPDVTDLYLDMPATPLYPFAHGLTYTQFSVTELRVGEAFTTDGSIEIAATVSNNGSRPGIAVPQLYFSAESLGVTRPAQQLGGFTRVQIEPGESVQVRFVLDAAQLGYTALDDTFVVDPGEIRVWIGLDATDDALQTAIVLEGGRRSLRASQRVFFSTATVSHR